MFKKINIKINENEVAYLCMNDRENRNCLSKELVDEFLSGLDYIEKDIQPKVCIICGLEDIFCSGAEKKHLIELSEGSLSVRDVKISERLVQVPFPTIAACQGHALGGGLAMAACCDIVVMAKESRYGAIFMNMGFTPGMGCTLLLQELVGPFIANEMMYTGKMYRGKELAVKGTNINAIVPKNVVMDKTKDMSLRIAEKGKKILYLLKNTLSSSKKELLRRAQAQEDNMHKICFNIPETKKNIEDFYNE